MSIEEQAMRWLGNGLLLLVVRHFYARMPCDRGSPQPARLKLFARWDDRAIVWPEYSCSICKRLEKKQRSLQ